MAQFQHKCSKKWLECRQEWLCASEVKELLPVTKTGRKRTVTDENYIKVWTRKITPITDQDCWSTGAAARGHILEPYAIEAFNKWYNAPMLYHWDDKLLIKDPMNSSLAFSPDALSISPDDYDATALIHPSGKKIMGEVKCYGAERHLLSGYTKPDELEERWQIATAMAVDEDIEKAYLIFYNPSLEQQMFVVEYTRDDLALEITIVKDVDRDWRAWLDNKDKFHNVMIMGSPVNEEAILTRIMEKETEEDAEVRTVLNLSWS